MRRLGKYYQLYSKLNAAEQNEVIKFIEQILNKYGVNYDGIKFIWKLHPFNIENTSFTGSGCFNSPYSYGSFCKWCAWSGLRNNWRPLCAIILYLFVCITD